MGIAREARQNLPMAAKQDRSDRASVDPVIALDWAEVRGIVRARAKTHIDQAGACLVRRHQMAFFNAAMV